jgi:hypothetical protein
MRKTFIAGTDLQPNRRVKITDATTSPKTVGYAGATDPAVAWTEDFVLSGKNFSAKLANGQGTVKASATETITGGNPVYAAASGQVASSGTVVEGKALETVTTSGDVLEVLPTHNSDISTAIAGTTAAAFEVDNDSATPKIALSGQAAGTGDFTTTLKPESTLSADNAIIVPESDGDTLAALGLAQTFTARKKFTGNTANTAGVGITGTAASFVATVTQLGTIIKTEILIDLTGLNSGGSADDIIGANGAGVAHLGQITDAVNGTIIAGRLTCLETPATGDNDINVFSATEATGVEDTAISALTETALCNSGDLTAGTVVALTPPAADQYLYLTGGTGDANATYTTGILLLEFWGKAA